MCFVFVLVFDVTGLLTPADNFFGRSLSRFGVHESIALTSNITPSGITAFQVGGLPPGSPPSTINNPALRAKYESAIAENKRKSQRVEKQLPFLLHGPQFKTRAERWLIQAYSQPPVRTAELKSYLTIYVQDGKARQRILSEVEKNSKSPPPQ